VVLVGDAEQLQAIEAGAAFRALPSATARPRSTRFAGSMRTGSGRDEGAGDRQDRRGDPCL
jgi:ATP-dependent exoDNAse (exonuclease V) alpha subunit